MKKLCIAGGLIAVLLVSICSTRALAGDKRNLDKLFPQTQYNTKAELAKDYVSGITQEKKEEKDKGKTKYKPITFSPRCKRQSTL